MATGERIDEPGGVGDAAQRQAGELQSGNPALGPRTQRRDLGAAKFQSHHVTEEGGRFVRCEAQIGGAQLDELTAGAQPGKRQRRVRPRRDR